MDKIIKTAFQKKFGHLPEIIVAAPGRINIIGEHTDYNNGFVLPAAINKYLYFGLKKNDHSKINFHSLDFNKSFTIPLPINEINFETAWKKYLQSIVLTLVENGNIIKGFDCNLTGNIPRGGGMSSSAALCCGLIFGLNQLFNLGLSKKEISALGQKAEHKIGFFCGIMDQTAVTFGKKNQVMLLDCKTLETSFFDLKLNQYSMFLINSMVEHEFATDSAYNQRRASCEKVASIINSKYGNIDSLREVSMTQLQDCKDQINDVDYKRAEYVIEENHRVLSLVKDLKDGNLSNLGLIFKEAQIGMRDKYQITIPEIDFLVDQITSHEDCLGARMMGGGFGGCTINFVKTTSKHKIIEPLLLDYKIRFGYKAEVYDLEIVDGIGLMRS